MMPKLTVFTPTYNRGYILPKLYASLCRQSSHDFEWLIVDDGSTDNTVELVDRWIAENKINIRYIRQANGGKHRAINRGVAEAKGNWFFIVDSDDYLTDDAVEWICYAGNDIADNDSFAGLSGTRIHPDGSRIGGDDDFGQIDANAIDIRLKYCVAGDLAEVFKTKILRQYPFPEFDGEKFCPEALVWFRIARKHKLRYYYKGIYVCEYLDDGLTSKITRIRRQSPRASMTFYAEHFHDNLPLKWKLKAAVNFWRFQLTHYSKEFKMLSPTSFICWLPGKIMGYLDRKK